MTAAAAVTGILLAAGGVLIGLCARLRGRGSERRADAALLAAFRRTGLHGELPPHGAQVGDDTLAMLEQRDLDDEAAELLGWRSCLNGCAPGECFYGCTRSGGGQLK
jgi:hypothetical protein